jgi:cytoplasmic iron level regulating protein YaaA (DUF328/UPF0246 family)
VLSPSKTLDYDTTPQTDKFTQPDFLDDSTELIEILREYDIDGLRDLMDISEKLAVLNVERYDDFETPFTPDNAKAAITAFTGDVYRDFRLDEYDADDFDFLQAHARILSGLYGLLRPLDLMQPYRLEMGTRLENARGKKLYDFWGTKITDAVNAALDAQGDDVLLNLASNEYFNSIDTKKLAGRVLSVNFKDLRKDKYKTITFYLKRLRGTMTDWMVRNRVTDPEGLKGFNERNYYFSEERSTEDDYVFLRDEKP